MQLVSKTNGGMQTATYQPVQTEDFGEYPRSEWLEELEDCYADVVGTGLLVIRS